MKSKFKFFLAMLLSLTMLFSTTAFAAEAKSSEHAETQSNFQLVDTFMLSAYPPGSGYSYIDTHYYTNNSYSTVKFEMTYVGTENGGCNIGITTPAGNGWSTNMNSTYNFKSKTFYQTGTYSFRMENISSYGTVVVVSVYVK